MVAERPGEGPGLPRVTQVVCDRVRSQDPVYLLGAAGKLLMLTRTPLGSLSNTIHPAFGWSPHPRGVSHHETS